MIADLAKSVSRSLSIVLRWAHWWHSTDERVFDVSSDAVLIELNSDYETSNMTGAELTALVGAWQAGAISHDTLLYKLEQGECLPPGRTIEKEIALIKANPAPALALAAASSV